MVRKIWLDDIRLPPDDSWRWAKSVWDAGVLLGLESISQTQEEIIISFDHDLGENTADGYDLACHIEKMAAEGKIYNIVEWKIHSANPVGAENIRKAMQSFDKFRVTEGLRKYMIKENEGIRNAHLKKEEQ